MKSIVVIVEDTLAETFAALLPAEGAWIMPPRHDAFRSGVTCELDRYRTAPATFIPLQQALKDAEATLTELSE